MNLFKFTFFTSQCAKTWPLADKFKVNVWNSRQCWYILQWYNVAWPRSSCSKYLKLRNLRNQKRHHIITFNQSDTPYFQDQMMHLFPLTSPEPCFVLSHMMMGHWWHDIVFLVSLKWHLDEFVRIPIFKLIYRDRTFVNTKFMWWLTTVSFSIFSNISLIKFFVVLCFSTTYKAVGFISQTARKAKFTQQPWWRNPHNAGN